MSTIDIDRNRKVPLAEVIRRASEPTDLFLGTHTDNARDRAAKGRNGSNRGGANGNAKLTWNQVREIRRLSPAIPHKVLAERYGISVKQVRAIVSRRCWNLAQREGV